MAQPLLPRKPGYLPTPRRRAGRLTLLFDICGWPGPWLAQILPGRQQSLIALIFCFCFPSGSGVSQDDSRQDVWLVDQRSLLNRCPPIRSSKKSLGNPSTSSLTNDTVACPRTKKACPRAMRSRAHGTREPFPWPSIRSREGSHSMGSRGTILAEVLVEGFRPSPLRLFPQSRCHFFMLLRTLRHHPGERRTRLPVRLIASAWPGRQKREVEHACIVGVVLAPPMGPAAYPASTTGRVSPPPQNNYHSMCRTDAVSGNSMCGRPREPHAALRESRSVVGEQLGG